MNMMKIVKSIEKSSSLIKNFSHTIKNEAKEQKWGLLKMLLRTLGDSLLRNLLTDKEVMVTSQGCEAKLPGRGTVRAGEGSIRAGQVF